MTKRLKNSNRLHFEQTDQILLSFLLALLLLVVFEGACFRLVEKYAELRQRVAWGVPGEGSYHPILKFFPLGHFSEPPSLTLASGQSASEMVSKESAYAESVMSFARPLRDRYEDYLENEFEPLANFEIRDFGPITGIVLPGLKRPATLEEVNQKMARRVGDELEYSKGILIRIISSMEAVDYETEFKNLESTFGFVLKKGIACLILPAQDADDVLETIDYLQTEHKLLAQNACSFGQTVGPRAMLWMPAGQTPKRSRQSCSATRRGSASARHERLALVDRPTVRRDGSGRGGRS